MTQLEPNFLDVEDVCLVQELSIVRYGGQLGIRDRGLLESAVSMPQQSAFGEWLHDSLFLMAAAYAFHIAQNQPFVDGNKRAGLGAALLFLNENGIEVDDIGGLLHGAMIDVANRRMTKEGLADLLESLSMLDDASAADSG